MLWPSSRLPPEHRASNRGHSAGPGPAHRGGSRWTRRFLARGRWDRAELAVWVNVKNLCRHGSRATVTRSQARSRCPIHDLADPSEELQCGPSPSSDDIFWQAPSCLSQFPSRHAFFGKPQQEQETDDSQRSKDHRIGRLLVQIGNQQEGQREDEAGLEDQPRGADHC
jgi:hypothetical protein